MRSIVWVFACIDTKNRTYVRIDIPCRICNNITNASAKGACTRPLEVIMRKASKQQSKTNKTQPKHVLGTGKLAQRYNSADHGLKVTNVKR